MSTISPELIRAYRLLQAQQPREEPTTTSSACSSDAADVKEREEKAEGEKDVGEGKEQQQQEEEEKANLRMTMETTNAMADSVYGLVDAVNRATLARVADSKVGGFIS